MKKITLILLPLLVIGIGIAHQFLNLFGTKTSSEVLTQESSGHVDNFADSDSLLSLPKASHAAQASPTHSISNPAGQPLSRETRLLLEAVLNQAVSIEHGGALRELALAKDELYVRNADGKGRVVSIPAATSASDLLGQFEKIQKETGSAPELIFYPTGAVRNDLTRRIVTRDILIEADSRSAADALAAASGLSFKSSPVFA